MAPPRIITLTTDFGVQDAYVGIMKGVMLGISPGASLIDITHGVPPQDVVVGAYLLQSAYRYFPARTVHLAVVDPGVGTERRPVAVAGPHGTFVGPDNGVLAACLADQGVVDPESGDVRSGQAVALEAKDLRLLSVSQTFHGRDIFAPAAAHLAAGVPLDRFGPPLARLEVSRIPLPRHADGDIVGAIIHVDRFGNAISNISHSALPALPVVQIGKHTVSGLARSYQDASVLAIVGSSGMLEIAVRNGSAAQSLNIRVGDAVVVRSGS